MTSDPPRTTPGLRIGCVPYLNAKPVIDWFHEPACDADVEVSYAVPSELARSLRKGSLDVALVSTVELFQSPGLRVVPDISISADGPVRSVRLFAKKPIDQIESVALDTGSLTSVALTRILLADLYGIQPRFEGQEPDLFRMLNDHDAALIIGRLDDYQPRPPYVLDLGAEWKNLTGLPFCYAAWLARKEVPSEPTTSVLERAKHWGAAHRGDLVRRWSDRMDLPAERVGEYLCQVIRYDLRKREQEAIDLFQHKCLQHGLIDQPVPVEYMGG